jgi:hypothetical protein
MNPLDPISLAVMDMTASAIDRIIEAAIAEPDPERRIQARTQRMMARVRRAMVKRERRAARRVAEGRCRDIP